MDKTDVRDALLVEGRRRVQANGYAALSFRELAAAVGVKSSSVHYYWPTKGDLAAELAARYTADGETYLGDLLAHSKDARAFFAGYIRIFRVALENENRMCLCGVLAAERDELPSDVIDQVNGFMDANVRWLSRALVHFAVTKTAKAALQRATAILAAVEGAQLLARSRGDLRVFDETVLAYRAAGLVP